MNKDLTLGIRFLPLGRFYWPAKERLGVLASALEVFSNNLIEIKRRP